MNNKNINKSDYNARNLYFILEFSPNVEGQYPVSNKYYLKFFYGYYVKFLDIFGKIYLKRNNYYLNLLSIQSLNLLSRLGIIYKKPYSYRIYILVGEFVNGKWEGKYTLDILITVRLKDDLFFLRIYNGEEFKRSKICFYDSNITFEIFKKNFMVLGGGIVTDNSCFYIDLPHIFELESDKYIEENIEPWICSDSEKLCRLFFNYLKNIE